VSVVDALAWTTLGIGLLVTAKGIQATLYFRHRLGLLEGNWVMLVTFRTVLTITVACLVLTVAGAYSLVFGATSWTRVVAGLAVIWILSVPWLILQAYRAHEE